MSAACAWCGETQGHWEWCQGFAINDPARPSCPECGGSGWKRNPSGLPLCSENGILGYLPCPLCTTRPEDGER